MIRYWLSQLISIALFMGLCLVTSPFSWADPGQCNPQLLSQQGGLSLSGWMNDRWAEAWPRLLANVQANGAVVAGINDPRGEYYFHWVRDAAIVTESILNRLQSSSDAIERQDLVTKLKTIALYSKNIQSIRNAGEPKFFPSGEPFDGKWGRPQNDGPALRATMMIRLSKFLMKNGDRRFVEKELYNADLSTHSLIKGDLEYISHHWNDQSFDPWEEEKGDIFFDRIVQMRALLQGADFASSIGDRKASSWYQLQGSKIRQSLDRFWSPPDKVIRMGLSLQQNSVHGNQPFDTQVVLAYLQSDLSVRDSKILASVYHLESAFRSRYRVNTELYSGPEFFGAVAIGRYPTDSYHGGNPWVLTNFVMAEFYFRLVSSVWAAGRIVIDENNIAFFNGLLGSGRPFTGSQLPIGQVLRPRDFLFRELVSRIFARGEGYLKIIKSLPPGVWRYEQFSKDAMTVGSMVGIGAENLTWNFAAFLSARDAWGQASDALGSN